MCERITDRRGFKKYLNKRMHYSGTVILVKDSTKILVGDVGLFGKSKVLADHIWIEKPTWDTTFYPKGSKIDFIGSAQSYRDMSGERKYSVDRIYALQVTKEELVELHEKAEHDARQKTLRKK